MHTTALLMTVALCALVLTGCCACDADPCACGGGVMCWAPCPPCNPCGPERDLGPVGETPAWAAAGLTSTDGVTYYEEITFTPDETDSDGTGN